MTFEISSLEKAEPFDPAYDDDAQKLCGVKGADVKGGVGPFGLWVLASADLQEKTAVFFRVFKDGHGKPKVLMCTDPTKYGPPTYILRPSCITTATLHMCMHIEGGTCVPPLCGRICFFRLQCSHKTK